MRIRRSVRAVLPLLVLLSSSTVIAVTGSATTTDVELLGPGIGYELVQERLDYLQYRFLELFVHVKELGETVLNNQRTIEKNLHQANQLAQSNQKKIIDRVGALERQNDLKTITDRLDDLESAVAANVSLVTEYAKQILDLQSICANHDSILKELNQLKPNCTSSGCSSRPAIYGESLTQVPATSVISSCNGTNSKTSGVFEIVLPDSTTPIKVYCEMQSFGGSWLVFQQRINGSLDFYRDWLSYRDGFGVVGEEFWLGLNALHRLTNQASYELMVELKDYSDNYEYARYSEFRIGSEAEKFILAELGTYAGTAGDGLGKHSGMKFTTFDNDNDRKRSGNCAEDYYGAWWYENCHYSNLNGKYMDKTNSDKEMCWNGCLIFRAKFTRMMIRLK